MNYEAVIGLEVHVQLKTDSKIFCGCSTRFGAEPNTQVCPVCLGLPGVLPVLNEKALEYAVMTGLALGCEIAPFSKFDRKNYYYPDLPKNYQISQYDLPICSGGTLEIDTEEGAKIVRITRAHLEEDAGKLLHSPAGNESLVDLNRTGVPLLEIVTEPDMRSPEEADAYLKALRSILLYLDVSDCNMEEGSMRCEANVSLRPRGSEGLGTKTELKNINSFRFVQRALRYEIERQGKILESGGKVKQETMRWDEDRGVTVPMRGKEEAQDYRYFPEPDLVPVVLSGESIEEIRKKIPELPLARKRRFIDAYGLPSYDASVLTIDPSLAVYFEEVAIKSGSPKQASNWVMGELLRLLNEKGLSPEACPVPPERLAEILGLVEKGTVSGKMAKEIFEEVFASGRAPGEIVRERGIEQISDEDELSRVVDDVIASNPKSVADFKGGTEKAIGFLVGQAMRATKGKGNPKLLNRLLRERLEGKG